MTEPLITTEELNAMAEEALAKLLLHGMPPRDYVQAMALGIHLGVKETMKRHGTEDARVSYVLYHLSRVLNLQRYGDITEEIYSTERQLVAEEFNVQLANLPTWEEVRGTL